MSTTNLEVKRMAAAIRSEFINAKAHVLDGTYRPSPAHDNHELWVKAATHCLSLEGGTPEKMVRAAFLYCGHPQGPFPNMMYSGAMTRWWEEYRNTVDDPVTGVSIENLVPYEINVTVRRLHEETGEDGIGPGSLELLRARWFSAEPYTRVVLSGGDPDIMDRFGADALLQMGENPEMIPVLEAHGVPAKRIQETLRGLISDNEQL